MTSRRTVAAPAGLFKFPVESPRPTLQTTAMSLIERTIQVSFQHRVYFTRHAFGVTNGLLRDLLLNGRSGAVAKALVVLDESLHRAQPNLAHSIEAYFNAFGECLELVCPPIILEGGERVKNSYFHVSEIQSHVERFHLDRHSYLVAVGGGALLDVAGLAAATAHRGVRHVRIPTTTLSQADSGVGVKNGINAFGKKNFIGTFSFPSQSSTILKCSPPCPPATSAPATSKRSRSLASATRGSSMRLSAMPQLCACS